jgi:hypothetical protein
MFKQTSAKLDESGVVSMSVGMTLNPGAESAKAICLAIAWAAWARHQPLNNLGTLPGFDLIEPCKSRMVREAPTSTTAPANMLNWICKQRVRATDANIFEAFYPVENTRVSTCGNENEEGSKNHF